MTAWLKTKFLWYREIPASRSTLYVVPYGVALAEASVHRQGTFEPFRLRWFRGSEAVEQAKQYLDRAEGE